MKVEEQSQKAAGGEASQCPATSGAARPGRVTQRQVENFTRELASLLSGGVRRACGRSFPAQAGKQGSRRPESCFGRKFMTMSFRARRWRMLFPAHPKSFSTVYVAMVRAGEAGIFSMSCSIRSLSSGPREQ